MLVYDSAFCTVNDVINQLEVSTSTDTSLASGINTLVTTKYANSVARIKSLIYEKSAQLTLLLNQTFVPYQATESRRCRLAIKDLWYAHGDYQLSLRWARNPLLAISSLSWAGEAKTSTLYAVGDGNSYPADYVALDTEITLSSSIDFADKLLITGTWGYHLNPDRLWLDSGDTVQNNPLSASATSLSVTSGTNFETYQYIRMESEWAFITSISSNTLTIQRGVLGTTASSHAQSTQIDTMQVDDVARSAVRRLVVIEFNNPSETKQIVATPEGTVRIETTREEIPVPPTRKMWWVV